MKNLKDSRANRMSGRYEISNDEYHTGPGISSSHLKPLIKSAAHYQAWLQAPKKESPEMALGSAVHTMVLEPDKFLLEYKIATTDDKRTKEYKQISEDNPGCTILTASQFETAKSCAASVNRAIAEDPNLAALFRNNALIEQAFYWTDPDSGVLCKVKPDVLAGFGVIADLKTTRDVSFDSFQKSIVDYMYFLSAAFYIDGVKLALEQSGNTELLATFPTSFVLLAVESSAPYDVKPYYFDQASIEIGRRLYKQALKTYAECTRTGIWPGIDKSFSEIGLPNWFLYKLNRK